MTFAAGPSPTLARPRRAAHALAAATAIAGSIACLSSASAAAEAGPTCTLYASSSGSDSNPGTAAAPVLTVKRLIERLPAGQTGCLASGQTFAGFTLYNGNSHGAEGAPVTITSTNPGEPARIDTRITTEAGADWLTFSHLILVEDVVGPPTENPSPTIGSKHTTWTYDDVSANDIGICFAPHQSGDQYGAGEYTLIEHDRVHDCGHPVSRAELESQANVIFEGRLSGWHAHGLYDEGQHTTVRNSYFYDNSGLGILLRGGSYAVIEHNVIDHNGRGVLFGDNGPNHDLVAWNIVTNTTTPCGKELGKANYCDSYGVSSYCNGTCSADVFANNDVFGNEAGNIAPPENLSSSITLEHNVEVDPQYANAAAHDYTLRAGSPAAGYGPDSTQPTATAPPALETPAAEGFQAKNRHPAIAASSLRRHRRHHHARKARRHRHARKAKWHHRARHHHRANGPRRHAQQHRRRGA
jgi:Right handed beta helix region